MRDLLNNLPALELATVLVGLVFIWSAHFISALKDKRRLALTRQDPKRPYRTAVAVVFYDSGTPQDEHWSVEVTGIGREFTNALTDWELKVFAIDASHELQKTLELPPPYERNEAHD